MRAFRSPSLWRLAARARRSGGLKSVGQARGSGQDALIGTTSPTMHATSRICRLHMQCKRTPLVDARASGASDAMATGSCSISRGGRQARERHDRAARPMALGSRWRRPKGAARTPPVAPPEQDRCSDRIRSHWGGSCWAPRAPMDDSATGSMQMHAKMTKSQLSLIRSQQPKWLCSKAVHARIDFRLGSILTIVRWPHHRPRNLNQSH